MMCHGYNLVYILLYTSGIQLFTENFIDCRIYVLPFKTFLVNTVFALNFIYMNLRKKIFACQKAGFHSFFLTAPFLYVNLFCLIFNTFSILFGCKFVCSSLSLFVSYFAPIDSVSMFFFHPKEFSFLFPDIPYRNFEFFE